MNLATKNISLFFFLLLIALLVNLPIMNYGMIYPEEATIYLANQSIHSFTDFLNIYLHPAWLNKNIPYFRPSGHFLIYQLITPLFGWHNIYLLYLISFSFLALIGFFMIKLYKLFFPSFAVGGFLAFSIYLMHPSLMISRMTFMHFDFSYVALLLCSLYFFVWFCSPDEKSIHPGYKLDPAPSRGTTTLCDNAHPRYKNLILSLFFFVLAVTFKEPAIMLGPVLFFYYCISTVSKNGRKNVLSKKSLLILFSIFATSAFLAWYLFLAWPSMRVSVGKFDLSHSLKTANISIQDIFAITASYIPFGKLPYEHYAWHTIIFTTPSRLILWVFFWLTFAAMIFSRQQKALLFLLMSALLFSILPLCCATGAPWHQSPTLACLCMMMGFAGEYYLKKPRLILFIAGLIAIIGMTVNVENLIKYNLEPKGLLGLTLNGSAVFFPPDIKNKLNDESILVVEDSILHNDYFLGNSIYPTFLYFSRQEYLSLVEFEKRFYFRFHPVYGGNLFKYVFLLPHLKEQLIPFQAEHMDDIPNELIYSWLIHNNNIFCVGYDAGGNWHDKTETFKTELARQQARRHLVIHHYTSIPPASLSLNHEHTKELSVPDMELCQFACDQNKNCKGFIYRDAKCHFHIKT